MEGEKEHTEETETIPISQPEESSVEAHEPSPRPQPAQPVSSIAPPDKPPLMRRTSIHEEIVSKSRQITFVQIIQNFLAHANEKSMTLIEDFNIPLEKKNMDKFYTLTDLFPNEVNAIEKLLYKIFKDGELTIQDTHHVVELVGIVTELIAKNIRYFKGINKLKFICNVASIMVVLFLQVHGLDVKNDVEGILRMIEETVRIVHIPSKGLIRCLLEVLFGSCTHVRKTLDTVSMRDK